MYPHILYYDHENSTWSPTYRVDDQGLTDDDHGPPALWVTNEGYIHVIYGAHNDPFYHAVSTSPNRIDQWTIEDTIGELRARGHIQMLFMMMSMTLFIFGSGVLTHQQDLVI